MANSPTARDCTSGLARHTTCILPPSLRYSLEERPGQAAPYPAQPYLCYFGVLLSEHVLTPLLPLTDKIDDHVDRVPGTSALYNSGNVYSLFDILDDVPER